MNKEEFNNLEIEKQIKYINNLLSKGYSIKKACQDVVGISDSTIRDRFKSKGYIRIENKYIKAADIKHINNTSVIINKHNSVKDVNEMAFSSVKDETNSIDVINIKKDNDNSKQAEDLPLQQITELINMKDKLLKVIEWHEQYNDVLVIDPKPINLGEGVTRSFKIDSKILEQFISFCEENKQYSQKDLLSWAIYLLMKKIDK